MSFVMLMRSPDTEELLKDNNAFAQLTQIALRAKRKPDVVTQNDVSTKLEVNQAFIGDYWNIGLTEGEYREAKKRLTLRKLATFKTTNKGTIATLINQDVFDINPETTTGKTTDKERTGSRQATTNNKFQEVKKNNKGIQEGSRQFLSRFKCFKPQKNPTVRDNKGPQRIGEIL
jgi:hypothetical protein